MRKQEWLYLIGVVAIGVWLGITMGMLAMPSYDDPVQDPTLAHVIHLQVEYVNHKLHKLW